MKFVLGLSIVLLIAMSSPLAKTAGSWTLYDNFNSEFLDIEKWGESQTRTGGVVALDVVREIQAQHLHMFIRAHGPTEPAPLWTYRRGDMEITSLEPNAFLGVRASVRVTEVEATQCPDVEVTQATLGRARVQVPFFHTGDCGDQPTGLQCHAVAEIVIQRYSNSQDPPGILQVRGQVAECKDQLCLESYHGANVPVGTIRVGQWTTVRVEWDQANHKFIFQLGNKPPQEVTYDPNEMPNYGTPKWPFRLGVNARIPYCSERQVLLMGAEFENVYVK